MGRREPGTSVRPPLPRSCTSDRWVAPVASSTVPSVPWPSPRRTIPLALTVMVVAIR